MRAAAVYFALVFGAGFLLGPIRVLFLEPRVGLRAAELTELPLMIVAITFAASDIVFHPREFLPEHPNGMTFTAQRADGTAYTETYFSIGGGAILRKGAPASASFRRIRLIMTVRSSDACHSPHTRSSSSSLV